MYTRESTQSLMGLIYYIKNELITYSLHPEYKYGDYVPSGIIMKNEENKNNIDKLFAPLTEQSDDWTRTINSLFDYDINFIIHNLIFSFNFTF